MKFPTAGLSETVLGGQGGFLGSGAGCMHCMVRLWKSFVWSGEAELSREWVVWRVEKAVFRPPLVGVQAPSDVNR